MLPLRHFLPPLSPKSDKAQEENCLIVEVGLERVVAAVFQSGGNKRLLGLGKSNLEGKEVAEKVSMALEGLRAVVSKLPKRAILGLGSPANLEKKVFKLERSSENREITREELEEILQNATPRNKMGDQLYFSSLIYVILDNNLVSFPIGARGKFLEVGILNAYYNQELLEKIQEQLLDTGLDLQKIVPTPHVLALYTQGKEMLSLLILRVGKHKTQVIAIKASSVDEVREFDLGSENLDLWLSGLVTALEQNNLEIPEYIWVYTEDNYNQELTIGKLQTLDWQGKFQVTPSLTGPELVDRFFSEDFVLVSLANYFLDGK